MIFSRTAFIAITAMLPLLWMQTVFGADHRQPSTPSIVRVNPLRDAYYGDLHLHTGYSFDAYLSSKIAIGPDEAYRFAKGEVVNYLGTPVRRREPLDFLAVTDHAENIGVFRELENPESSVSHSDVGKVFKEFQALIMGTATEAHHDPTLSDRLLPFIWDFFSGSRNKLPENLKPELASAWERVVDFANRNYEPGKFTTFIAYEWTAMPYGANLHRNVIFRGGSAPAPFTSFDSTYPEDLWAWLQAIRKKGYEALAIPHNANASNGLMYDWVASDSLPIGRAYAQTRQDNEPLSEIAQIKGASETHPLLSPNDEMADFEIYDFMAAVRHRAGQLPGSYLRDGLSRGLVLERQLGINPFKYGFVGGSDIHSGLSVSAQEDYAGRGDSANMGGGRPTRDRAASALDPTRGSTGIGLKTTSGSLTGVWAKSNTREAIFDALRRRETFATSGTRLRLRFFGGWEFSKALLSRRDWLQKAYHTGVPMGSDLPKRPSSVMVPTFLVWAAKGPNGANLDKVQIVKVWEQDGQQKEKIFDVAWSGPRRLNVESNKLPAIGNTVDLITGQYTNDIGSAELKAVWSDPEFDASRFAAYYLRVLEIPTPRWSTLLAIEHSLPIPKDVPAVVRQRGWSSPIWYQPSLNSAH